MDALSVSIPSGDVVLEGTLTVPPEPTSVVLFAHGSGSSRHSPRNRYVASVLEEAGLATLLMDLLTAPEDAAEARGALLRFDVAVLAKRLVDATHWLDGRCTVADLPVGYFGASTGAAAALVAAAELASGIAAVVSRGGRPDLAGDALARVTAPTLLIVGGDDHAVIEMNATALHQLQCTKRLDIVPGASHLFQEPGTLEQVADLARSWFKEATT